MLFVEVAEDTLFVNVPPAAFEILKLLGAVASTCIPVAVTVVFIENQAKVEEPIKRAEMSNIERAGRSFLNFFILDK